MHRRKSDTFGEMRIRINDIEKPTIRQKALSFGYNIVAGGIKGFTRSTALQAMTYLMISAGPAKADGERSIPTLSICETPEVILGGVIPSAPREPELCAPVYIIPGEISKKVVRIIAT